MEEPRSPVLSKPNSCSRMPLFYTEDLLQKGQFDNPKTLSGLAWEDPFNLTNWCTLPECEYHNEDSANVMAHYMEAHLHVGPGQPHLCRWCDYSNPTSLREHWRKNMHEERWPRISPCTNGCGKSWFRIGWTKRDEHLEKTCPVRANRPRGQHGRVWAGPDIGFIPASESASPPPPSPRIVHPTGNEVSLPRDQQNAFMFSDSSQIPLPDLSGPGDSARAHWFGGYTQQVQVPHLPQTTFSPMARQSTPGPILRHGFNPFIDESQLSSGFATHPPPTSTWLPNCGQLYPDDPYFNPFHHFFGPTPLPYFPEHQYYGHNLTLAQTPFPSTPTSFVDVPQNCRGPARPDEMLPRYNSLTPSYTGRPPCPPNPHGRSITTSSRDASRVVARRIRSRSPHSKASTLRGHDSYEVCRARD